MTVQDTRRAAVVPGPRTAEPAPAGETPSTGPELRTRPRSEYWDVETASWTSRSPVPGPRQGD
jgi:hypothetical protein